jgi:hypothetical protein
VSKLLQMTFCLMFLLICSAVVSAASPDKEGAAVSAAEKWLALIDNGKYSESWKEAANYFRNAVAREQWEQSLKAVRKPLGDVILRTVKSKTYQTSLPGAPDGQYVVIQFETLFEKKDHAIETVTPMIDTDGKWRVSGYYIK